jgi:ATP-dependent Clp protease ATP-binding subunit ClpA
MYERFTDRARKVMQLANQEALRLNHEYIGTEHILLGLVREGTGVAVNVLKNLDIDLRMVRIEVENIVQAGPDVVTIGKLPLTPRAKRVVEYSLEEAATLDHQHVGTEHLLLGVLREQNGVASQVLFNLGVKIEGVRDEILALLGVKKTPNDAETPPESGRCSCRQMDDCPIKDLICDRDGGVTNDLCTADELRDWLRRVMTAQDLVKWMERAQNAESRLSRIVDISTGLHEEDEDGTA